MSNIVSKLRLMAKCTSMDLSFADEAADEIERLQKEVQRLDRMSDRMFDHIQSAAHEPTLHHFDTSYSSDTGEVKHTHTEAKSTASLWQPIATAPKDGSDILVCAPSVYGDFSVVSLSAWLGSANGGTVDRWAGIKLGSKYLPTHWMPLPRPPEENQ